MKIDCPKCGTEIVIDKLFLHLRYGDEPIDILALQDRLAEAERISLLCLPLTQWVMSLNFDEINDVSDLEGMYEPARKINEMIQAFLTHAPSDWVAVQRDKLTTILNRWDALELDLAIRYGGVEAIPELVDAKKSIKAALEDKP